MNYIKDFNVTIVFNTNGIPALLFPIGVQSCTIRKHDIDTLYGSQRKPMSSYQTRYFVDGTRCVNEYHNKYNKNLTPTRSKSLF
jgi:hypothetical protein